MFNSSNDQFNTFSGKGNLCRLLVDFEIPKSLCWRFMGFISVFRDHFGPNFGLNTHFSTLGLFHTGLPTKSRNLVHFWFNSFMEGFGGF